MAHSSYKKQQKLYENWRRYLKEEAPSITQVQTTNKSFQQQKCKWKYNVPGMKVFFDITSFSDANQNFFGRMIIAGNAITKLFKGKIKGALGASNHVGIIFSDGSIFHATSDETGVSFQKSYEDIDTNPHQYVVLNLGGDENELKKVCQDILNQLKSKNEPSKAYDWKGIARQVPLAGKLLAHLKIAKETSPYEFYCSELVANALVRVGFMNEQQLLSRMMNEQEELTQLDKADEISPTELYELISPKANLIAVKCEIENKPQQ